MGLKKDVYSLAKTRFSLETVVVNDFNSVSSSVVEDVDSVAPASAAVEDSMTS
jgi:hypothetical protein